jgi:hypothetical protein
MLDGVQEFKARSKAWSSALVASCNGDEGRLELGDLAGVLWAWRRTANRKGSGKRRSYPGVQVVEASLMAKSAKSRCCGAPAIPHRSFVWQQRDSDADALIVLVLKRRRNYVREVRMTEKEKEVQKKIQGRVEAYQTPAMLSGRGGGAALLTMVAWRRFS